jgi:hypothetical protein
MMYSFSVKRWRADEKVLSAALRMYLLRLYASATREQVEDEDDECQYQKQVDPRSENREPDKADKPKNDKDYSNCPKHDELL